ncbi:MAG: helix-turn-helix domain-containing protein [Rikenellaceae bacterium]
MDNNGCGFQVVRCGRATAPASYNFVGAISFIRCERGSAKVDRDGSQFAFCAGSHIALYESSMFRILDATDDFEYVECRAELDFAAELYPYLDNSAWGVFENNNSLVTEVSPMDMLAIYFQQLCNLYDSGEVQYSRQIALHTFLGYILTLYNRLVVLGENSGNSVSVNYSSKVDHFYHLCSMHHASWRTIDLYADELNMSKRHLYSIVQESTGMSPKQILDGFIIATIKKMLLTTSLTIQQIAEELNFPDQSTLRQFFFRKIGVPPSEWRWRR